MPILLLINATLNWGSTGHISEQIANAAQKHGWQCYIAHGSRYVNNSQHSSFPVGSKFDDILHIIKSMLFCAHGQGSIAATKRLIKRIKNIHPDVIHLHNIHGYYINYQILFDYLSKEKIPVVWTLHDCWSMTGHCTHFDSIGCNKWQTECYNCPLLRTGYKSFLFDRSRKNYYLKKKSFSSLSTVYIAPVSNWLNRIVHESFLKNYPSYVMYNGIDLNIFHKSSNCLKSAYNLEGKFIILGVGRIWHNGKGLQEFIKLSENTDYQVILIGVDKQVKQQLPSSIISINRTSNQQELVDYYSLADVLANPTYNDSFPTINLEALACGTPVITYETGGSPEAIDNETGIVVPRGDFQGLVNAIELVRKNGKEFYSDACRKRAEEYFDKEKCFNKYIELYENILKEE